VPVPSPPTVYEYVAEIQPRSAYIHIVDKTDVPFIILNYDRHAAQAIRAIEAKVIELCEKVDRLSATMEARLESQPIMFLESGSDDRTDELLLNEIRAVFETAGDEVLYPSDVAQSLSISYERSTKLIEKLEEDGKVQKA